MADAAAAVQTLLQIKASGVQLAIDDDFEYRLLFLELPAAATAGYAEDRPVFH